MMYRNSTELNHVVPSKKGNATRLMRLALLSGALGFALSSASAANITWIRTTGQFSNWNTAAAWGPATVPTGTDTAIFDGSGTSQTQLTVGTTTVGNVLITGTGNPTIFAPNTAGNYNLVVNGTFGSSSSTQTTLIRSNVAGLVSLTTNVISASSGAKIFLGNTTPATTLQAFSATTTLIGDNSEISMNVATTASLGDVTIGNAGLLFLLNQTGTVTGTTTMTSLSSTAANATVENSAQTTNASIETLVLTTSGTTATYAGVVKNSGTNLAPTNILNLVMNGSGTQVLSGSNAYFGSTTVNSGVLSMNGFSGSGATLVTGGELLMTGNYTGTGSLTVNGGELLMSGNFTGTGSTVVNGGELLMTGSNTGIGSMTVNAGQMILTGNNSAAGQTAAINGGILQLGDGTSNGNLSTTSTVMLNTGTLEYITSGSRQADSAISGTGTVIYASGTTVLFSNNGVDSHSGTTQINSGATLQVSNLGTTGTLSPNALVVDNGTLMFAHQNNIAYSGTITGAGALIQDGSNAAGTSFGRLTLSASNSYTGLTTVSAGTLAVTSNNGLGTADAGTVVASGAVLNLNNVNYTTAEAVSISGTGFGLGALNNTGTSTFAGAITAVTNSTISAGGAGNVLNLTGGIVKDGTVLTVVGGGIVNVSGVGISGASANSDLVVDASTLNISAASTYNGPTTVQNSGVLQLGADNVLPTAPRTGLTLNTSGNLDMNGHSDSVASLSGDSTGKVTNTATSGTSVLTLNGSGTTDFTGVIEDGSSGAKVALIKSGLSTQTLSGNNTYTGNTTVSAGSLLVTGGLSSSTAVTVARGATFGVGKGAGGGAFKSQALASLDTGSGTGLETVIKLDLGTAGNNDAITTGAFTLNGQPVNLVLTSTDVTSGTYTLMTWTSGGFTDLTTQLDIAGSSGDILLTNFSISGDSLLYTVGTVPEPTSLALLGAGSLAVVLFRRRRRTGV